MPAPGTQENPSGRRRRSRRPASQQGPAGGATFDALILAGGRARRLGGIDKATERVGGLTLLERVSAAVAAAGAAQVIVVGPEQPGGPVAAIAAGLAHVTAPDVVVLAADLPFITPAAVDQLRHALTTGVALPTDETGRDQPLCAAWRASALRASVAALGDPEGASVRSLIAACPAVVRVHMGGDPPPWFDCDTPEDLSRARGWAGG